MTHHSNRPHPRTPHSSHPPRRPPAGSRRIIHYRHHRPPRRRQPHRTAGTTLHDRHNPNHRRSPNPNKLPGPQSTCQRERPLLPPHQPATGRLPPHRPRSHRYLPPPGHELLSHRPTHPHYRHPRERRHPELRARRHPPLLRLQPARHSHYPAPGSHPQLRYRPSKRHHHTLDTRMERGRNGTLKSSSSLAFLPHKTYLCLRKTTTSTLIKTFNETTRTIPLSLS